MKVRDLIEELKQMPQDGNIELARLFAVTRDGETYDLRLDFPIIGLASRDDDVLLVVEHAEQLAKFGKVIKFGELRKSLEN